MYIEQAFKSGTSSWNYLLKYFAGLLIVGIAVIIGQIPFTLAVVAQSMADGGGMNISADNVMKILEPNLSLFLMLLMYVFIVAAIFFTARFLHHQTIRSLTTSRPKIDWSRIFFSFAIWAGFSVVSTVLMYYFYPEDFELAFKPIPFLILFVIATIMIPFQTSAEEYIFRGYLMQGLGVITGRRWFPLVFTSVMFGGMHYFNPEVGKMGDIIMVYYIGTGLFLGIITLMDEGMELALGFHAANNLLGALLVTSDWSAFQTYSIFKSIAQPDVTADVLVPVVVIFPILLFIFSKKYGWNDWIRKLTGTITPIAESANSNTNTNGNDDTTDIS